MHNPVFSAHHIWFLTFYIAWGLECFKHLVFIPWLFFFFLITLPNWFSCLWTCITLDKLWKEKRLRLSLIYPQERGLAVVSAPVSDEYQWNNINILCHIKNQIGKHCSNRMHDWITILSTNVSLTYVQAESIYLTGMHVCLIKNNSSHHFIRVSFYSNPKITDSWKQVAPWWRSPDWPTGSKQNVEGI